MGDTTGYFRKHAAQLPAAGRRLFKGIVPDGGSDTECCLSDRELPQFGDEVDINEVTRPGEPKSHHGQEALTSRKHAPIVRR